MCEVLIVPFKNGNVTLGGNVEFGGADVEFGGADVGPGGAAGFGAIPSANITAYPKKLAPKLTSVMLTGIPKKSVGNTTPGEQCFTSGSDRDMNLLRHREFARLWHKPCSSQSGLSNIFQVECDTFCQTGK